jgi:hypothetical protein
MPEQVKGPEPPAYWTVDTVQRFLHHSFDGSVILDGLIIDHGFCTLQVQYREHPGDRPRWLTKRVDQ